MKRKRRLTEAGHKKIVEGNFNRWMKRARERHGDRFDYSSTAEAFETSKRPKVPINCPEHGVFMVAPGLHVTNDSGGCPDCASGLKSKIKSQMYLESYHEWLVESLPENVEVVGEFKGPNAPLQLMCKKHGTIKTTKAVYLKNNKSHGCDACAREATIASRRLALADVRDELADDLPSHIHLLGLRRGETGTRLQMKCDRHGEFETTKGSAMGAAYYCHECAREMAGYTNHRLLRLIETGEAGVPTEIGVMIVKVFEISAIKVGVTTRSLTERYAWYLDEVVWSAILSERDAYVLEARIHRMCRDWYDPRIFYAGMRNGKRWAGDTEIYYLERAQFIVETAKCQLQILLAEEVDYQRELGVMNAEIVERDSINVSRPKDLTNLPVAVVGVDPVTLKIVHEFESLADATSAGFRNVSSVINPNNSRTISNGLRFFRKDMFDLSSIEPLTRVQHGYPVRCIERDEHFWNAADAASIMISRGLSVSPSHITSVCNGKRSVAGGYTWERSELSEEGVASYNEQHVKDVAPKTPQNVRKCVRAFVAETGQYVGEYPSRTAAADALGLSHAGVITNAIKHRSGIANGYRFEEA